MHHIVGGKHEQCRPHDPARTDIIPENRLVRFSGENKVCPEENHQGQCCAQRVAVYVLLHHILNFQDVNLEAILSFSKIQNSFLNDFLSNVIPTGIAVIPVSIIVIPTGRSEWGDLSIE